MINEKTERLLEQLAEDPARFDEKGGAYALLQSLFHEADISFVSSLLRSDDPHIVKVAIFCASELGARAYPLMQDVLPLAASEEISTAYGALEVIAVCSVRERISDYWVLLNSLLHHEQVIRVRVMSLMVNGDQLQFDAAAKSGRLDENHSEGLALLGQGKKADPQHLIQSMVHGSALTARYCAVIAARSSWRFSDAVDGKLDSQKMEDLSAFLRLKSIQRRYG
jgi:hypothetical protein